MIGNFNATINNTQFEFHTMNAKRLQLFQVYVLHDGKKVRFHMQRKGEGEFYITDPDKVPDPYKGLQAAFNEAILNYGMTLT